MAGSGLTNDGDAPGIAYNEGEVTAAGRDWMVGPRAVGGLGWGTVGEGAGGSGPSGAVEAS